MIIDQRFNIDMSKDDEQLTKLRKKYAKLS